MTVLAGAPLPELAGQVAIVIGGTLGIGRAAANALARAGAAVMICGSQRAHLDAALSELSVDGLTVDGQVCDATDGAQVERLIAATVSRFGGIDILVNSAGIQRYGTAVDTTEETWDRVFDVNVKAMFLTSKHAIPEMRKRSGGSIVNVSSVQAFMALPNSLAYVASKGAVVALTRALALDHAAEGIRVNAVCPASIDTPLLRWVADQFRGDRTADEMIAEWGQGHPIGRIGRVEDVAALITFLASPRSSFITGAAIPIDGGLLSALPVDRRPRPEER